jgi:uncharacterized protein YecE (DUF72 family)
VILVGAAGYSYDDWRGHFYPADLPKTKFLEYYAERLPAVEINYTYYQPPTRRTMEAMRARTKGRLHFAVKLHGSMTHDRTAAPEAYGEFVAACAPLAEAGVLGALLAQFPFSFHATGESCDYLRRLRDQLPGQDVVVEMRNAAWVKQETFDLLKELNFGWCNVDEPRLRGLMPPTALATSDVGYVRFHGRNAAKWFQHEHAYERYDYLYSEDELREWVPRIRQIANLTKRTYVFTNNHFESKAAINALMLITLLR